MLGFLANVIEQLDVALEHLTKCDANNARFGLMLTDNIVELMLHQIAKDKKNELKMFSYMREEFKHTAALEKALGRPFESKVKFAKVLGTFLDEIAESIFNLALPQKRGLSRRRAARSRTPDFGNLLFQDSLRLPAELLSSRFGLGIKSTTS
jgi:hypothetical protein